MPQEAINTKPPAVLGTPGYCPFMDPAVQREPHGYYRQLLENQPVFWDEVLQLFVVSSAKLIRTAALDTGTFSSVGSLDFGNGGRANPEAEKIRACSYITEPLTVV